ncbi:MAG: hypothetical protein NC483_00870 [Ruminococcus sp.]|nr:hypothetical protein [Ruminococcus sp.]
MKNTKKQINGPYHHEIEEEQKTFYYKRKFYSDHKDFKSFENLNNKTTNKIQTTIKILFPETEFPKNSSKRYYAVMKYLISTKGDKEFPTYDEKIVFLIEAIDHELSVYYYLLHNGYSPSDEEPLKSKRAQDLINFIKKTIGVFDSNFLRYEELYFRKFLKVSDIISYVNRDYSTKFFEGFNDIKSFNEINNIPLSFFLKKAEYYIVNCKNPDNPNTLCFNMNNPNSILELWHPLYRAIFFILVIDPELKALQIYIEEYRIPYIKKRMIEEFGFYHENFIKLEKIYRKKFYPENKLNAWSELDLK